MKFSSEDLMKAMGLQVGDRIKIEKSDCIYIIDDEYKMIHENGLASNFSYMSIKGLIDLEVEILPRPKRVGDTLCKECISKLGCRECPIQAICKGDWDNATLYKILQYWKESDSFDQEIYDLLKARLDKEVKE